MPTINSILGTAAGALRTSQNAINVTANNLSNASTEGYSRQRVEIGQFEPNFTGEGIFGTGAAVKNVTRVRDQFLDITYRREAATTGQNQARSQLMERIQTVLGEPGTRGMTNALDSFFNSWSELATHPTDGTVRNLVKRSGEDLAATFNRIGGDLGRVRGEAETRLLSAVDTINALTAQIADINRELVSQEAAGLQSPGLRDQRDRALDELAGLATIDVSWRDNNGVGVAIGGIAVVDGADFTEVETRAVGSRTELGIVGRATTIGAPSGQVGGMLGFINDDMTAARGALDDLAAAIVTDINAIHQTGTSPDGTTGTDFFDPTKLTSGTIALSTALAADVNKLAAGTADGAGNYRSGATDVAVSMASYRTNPSATLGKGFGEHMRGLVSDVGLGVRSSAEAAEVHNALLGQVDNRRQSVSGVSTDEELISLIRYQTSYQAAARIISTADELLQTVLNI